MGRLVTPADPTPCLRQNDILRTFRCSPLATDRHASCSLHVSHLVHRNGHAREDTRHHVQRRAKKEAEGKERKEENTGREYFVRLAYVNTQGSGGKGTRKMAVAGCPSTKHHTHSHTRGVGRGRAVDPRHACSFFFVSFSIPFGLARRRPSSRHSLGILSPYDSL